MTTYYSTNNLFQYTITNNSSSYTEDSDDYTIIAAAFNKWDDIVDKDSRFSSYTITVSVTFDTLGSGILGGASINTVYYFGSMSFGNTFPASGTITLSDSYLPTLKSTTHDDGNTSYYHVFLHEVGHILGIGSLWSITDFPKTSYTEDNTTKYYYTGEKALAEYKNYFQDFSYNDFLGVPIEDDGSSGTVNVHPEEGTEGSVSSDDRYINGIFHPGLDTELMTGWLDSSPTNAPLSRISIAFLEDMGFVVDYSYADNYRGYSYDSFSGNISYNQSMTSWLDNSANANTLKSTYIKGFLDVSGGSIITRNSSDQLLIAGDSSFNSNAYFSNTGVGIGISEPSHALDISGTLNITNGNLYVRDDLSLNNGTFSVLGDLSANQKVISVNSTSANDFTFDSSTNFQKRLFVNAEDINYNGTYLSNSINLFTFDRGSTGNRFYSGYLSEDGDIFASGSDSHNSNVGQTRVYEYRTVSQSEWDSANRTNTTYQQNKKVLITGGDTSLDTSKKYWIQKGYDIPRNNNDLGYNQTYYLACGGMSSDGEYILVTSIASGYGYYVYKWDSTAGRYILFGSTDIIQPTNLSTNQLRPGNVSMSSDGLTIATWYGTGIDIMRSNGSGNYQSAGSISLSYSTRIISLSGNGLRVTGINRFANTLRVYENNGVDTTWSQLGSDITTPASMITVRLNYDGTILFVGGSSNCWVYKYTTSWSLYQTINLSGFNIAINKDGDKLLIPSSSVPRIYKDNGTSFQQESISFPSYSYGFGTDSNYTGNRVEMSGDGSTWTSPYMGSYNNAISGYSQSDTPVVKSVDETIFQTHASDLASNGTFSSDISFNHSLIVPGNMVVVDASNVNTYGSYTTYTDPSGLVFFNVGKSKSHVFNIVNQDNVGVYMNTGSTSFTSTSDANLKKNVEPSADSLDKIMKLNPCTFDWKHNDKKEIGFIAQEVEEVYPELVDENETIDGSKYKGIKMSGLIPEIVNSLRELNKECDNLANSFN